VSLLLVIAFLGSRVLDLRSQCAIQLFTLFCLSTWKLLFSDFLDILRMIMLMLCFCWSFYAERISGKFFVVQDIGAIIDCL